MPHNIYNLLITLSSAGVTLHYIYIVSWKSGPPTDDDNVVKT